MMLVEQSKYNDYLLLATMYFVKTTMYVNVVLMMICGCDPCKARIWVRAT